MSLWQFRAAADGWIEANSTEQAADALSDDDHDALMAKHA